MPKIETKIGTTLGDLLVATPCIKTVLAKKRKSVLFHAIFNCPIRETSKNETWPVRPTLGKIVLLGRRPTRQIRL